MNECLAVCDVERQVGKFLASKIKGWVRGNLMSIDEE